MIPCLPLSRGRLRPARTDDLDALTDLLHDAEVRRYLCDDIVLPRETVAAMLADHASLQTQGLGLWVVERKCGDFSGVAGLQPVSDAIADAPAMTGAIEPIVALAPTCWGQGLAAEALIALIGYARSTLLPMRLVGAVDQQNQRSHRLMQRCGFKTAGSQPGPAGELILYELMLDGRAGSG